MLFAGKSYHQPAAVAAVTQLLTIDELMNQLLAASASTRLLFVAGLLNSDLNTNVSFVTHSEYECFYSSWKF